MTQKRNPFEFQDYKEFLQLALEDLSGVVKGVRSRLAEALACRSAYLTHVLSGSAHLTPDQAIGTCEFLKLNELETKYFVELVNFARAGTPKLRTYIQRQLKAIQAERGDLEKRIKSERIQDQQALEIFYSSWHYGAIHIALTIPRYRTAAALEHTLGIPRPAVEDSLQFLLNANLIKKDGKGGFVPTNNQIHLPKNSPVIIRHHTNWRLRALTALSAKDPDALHYSSVISIAESDQPQVRKILVQAIEEVRACVKSSAPEEAVYCYDVDFFKVSS